MGGALADGQHPFVLGDALDRDRLIDWLWAAVSDLAALAWWWRPSAQLERGDVHLLTALPGGRACRLSCTLNS